MAEEEKDKQLDGLLDSLLSQYASEEPRPGLETRVLARMADSRRGKVSVWRWLCLGAGAAAMAAVVIALLVSTRSRPRPTTPAIAQSQPRSSSAKAALTAGETSRAPRPTVRPGKKLIRHARDIEVRKDVFPTPEPLSEQEKLMLRYLSATPRQELLAQSHPDPLPDERAPRDESQPRF